MCAFLLLKFVSIYAFEKTKTEVGVGVCDSRLTNYNNLNPLFWNNVCSKQQLVREAYKAWAHKARKDKHMEHEILRKPRWFSINRRDLGQIKQELQSTQASSTDNPARQPGSPRHKNPPTMTTLALSTVPSRFTNPTGPVKSAGSGSDIPDRFDRKPIQTDWIQIWIQKPQCNRFEPVRPVYRPVWPVYRWFNDIFRRLKVVLLCEIKGNFDMSYAHINVNDHIKATIYNHAYKYNSNKRAYKYRVIHLYTSNKSST
jgi:hypothetical protein